MYICSVRLVSNSFTLSEKWTLDTEERGKKKTRAAMQHAFHWLGLNGSRPDYDRSLSLFAATKWLHILPMCGWDKHSHEWLHDCVDTHRKAVRCGTIFPSISNVSLENTIVSGMKGEVVTVFSRVDTWINLFWLRGKSPLIEKTSVLIRLGECPLVNSKLMFN